MYGDTYDVVVSGICGAFVINSGRIAAENALKYTGAATISAEGNGG
jgi:hypothetical protein